MSEFGEEFSQFFLLFCMFTVQGISNGMTAAIPLLFHQVSYGKQALFSLVSWPLSFKIMWAPFVDNVYSSSFGKRKSWIVPCQLLIGFFLLHLSEEDDFFTATQTTDAQVKWITGAFFIYNIIVASHDTAVDGWTLAHFSRQNMANASACNSLGSILGYLIGNTMFLSLTSPEFCNDYLRSSYEEKAIVSYKDYLIFLASLHFSIMALILLFTKEPLDGARIGIAKTYQNIYHWLFRPPLQTLSIILLTSKIAFATVEVYRMKLIELGASPQILAFMNIPVLFFEVLSTSVASKYVRTRPLDVFFLVYPLRLLVGPLFAMLVRWHDLNGNGDPSTTFYLVVFMVFAFSQMCVYAMTVATTAFSNAISDPAVGATYITLLNTITNLGSKWPPTFALSTMDPLTVRQCYFSWIGQEVCDVWLDGYYLLTAVCFGIGIVWLIWATKRAEEIQDEPLSSWSKHSSWARVRRYMRDKRKPPLSHGFKGPYKSNNRFNEK